MNHLNAKRINHVTVAVPAGEHTRVRAFYGDILGLEEIPRPAELNAVYDLMWFKLLDILLHIDFTPPWHQPRGKPACRARNPGPAGGTPLS